MKTKLRIASVALAVAAAVILGVWILRPAASPPRAVPPGSLEAADLSRLASAALVRPQSEAKVGELASRLEQSVLRASATLPSEHALTEAQASDLARLVRARVDLLLAPNYDKYRKHVMDLTGRDPDGTPPGGVMVSLKMWEGAAAQFRFIPIDVENVQVRCRFRHGKKEPYRLGGHTTYMSDRTGFYSSIGDKPEASGMDIYVVSVPMEVRDIKGGKPVAVLYVLSVAWRPDLQRWAPWECGFNDVLDDGTTMLPAAWI